MTMQFRMRTMLVATTILGMALAGSAASPVATRAGLGAAVACTWLGAGAVPWALKRVLTARRGAWTMLLAAVLVAATGFAAASYFGGLALRDHGRSASPAP
jgi:hypothetical protein